MAVKAADQSVNLVAAVESVRAIVSETLKATRETYADMKADFNQKHQENIDVRNNLQGKVDDLGSRVLLVESTLRTVVGDNTGESGLLHEVKRGQDQLKDQVKDGLNEAREEFRRGLQNLASDIREIKTTASSAPTTRDWMNKWGGVGTAIAILGSIALILTAAVEILRR